MRRLAVLALAAGLVWSVLPVAPAAVGAQTVITLSVVDGSNTNTAVTSLGEDDAVGGKFFHLKATAASASSSPVTVTVTRGGNATVSDLTLIPLGFGFRAECRSGDACMSSTVFLNVTIPANQTSGTTIFSWPVYTRSDTITEDHETITFSGTASGYTVNGTTLTITDQDRAIKVDIPSDFLVMPERGEGESVNRNGRHVYWPNSRKAVLGGVTNGVFTASTSSTYSQNLSGMRLKVVSGTATQSENF